MKVRIARYQALRPSFSFFVLLLLFITLSISIHALAEEQDIEVHSADGPSSNIAAVEHRIIEEGGNDPSKLVDENNQTRQVTNRADEGQTGTSLQSGALKDSNETSVDDGANLSRPAGDASKEGDVITKDESGTATKVDCSTQLCPELTNRLVETVESEGCRSMFVTGKCTVGCLSALKEVTSNTSWVGCTTQCAGGVADGGAERYVDLCEARQGNLLDVGKEAVATSFKGFPTWTALLLLMVLVTVGLGVKSSGIYRKWGKHARRRSGDSTNLLPTHSSSSSSHHRNHVNSILV